jgi:short-subunit dehydrogenase
MRERGRGGVIVVSSVSGFCAARGMVSYNASKAYDLIFAEGLASELRVYGVDVQAMCPGGTYSEFQRVAGLEPKNFGLLQRLMFTTPTAVVATSLNTLGGHVTVVHGWLNRLLVLSMKLVPRPISTWIFGAFVQRFADSH